MAKIPRKSVEVPASRRSKAKPVVGGRLRNSSEEGGRVAVRDAAGFLSADDEYGVAPDDDFEFEEAAVDEGAGEVEVEEASEGTDDPVRMYLMQMGQIPLLNRAEEIASAKEIERTRTLYRNMMLATDYVLQGACEILEKVHKCKLRLDRTIEVSVTNTVEK